MISIEIKGGDARSLELFNTEAVIIFFSTGDLIAITLAYHALYVSVGFPIHTYKYAHVQPKAEVIAGLRSRLSDQFQPPPLPAMVGARSALLRSADTSNTIAREFRPVARQLVCPGD